MRDASPGFADARARVRCAATAMLAVVVVGAGATPVRAQSAATRLAAVRDGQVRFTFTLRPGVCGQGQNVWRTGVSRTRTRTTLDTDERRDVEYDVECDSGPGRVVIDKNEGAITDVRFYIGGRWRASAAAADLGAVGARETSQILLAIVQGEGGRVSERAIFPLTLIDSVDVNGDLLRIARNDTRPSSTRKQAVFWLGQAAEGPATAGLTELVGEAALNRDVREQAVFALSQRPRDEGVPSLINVVRTNRDPEIRRKALFWLGQSGDPRAVDLIEELLTRR
ncbi:MAG: HEAT repeat domain-containing protein [Gemmatimonadaceae bacterium]|nr:HEAT repeat domain-containing protein [Gemmatimonadaceae bacterium]